MKSLLVYVLGMVLVNSAMAAIPKLAAPKPNEAKFFKQGVVIGGEAGDGFTLLDVRTKKSGSGKIERIVLEVGDIYGQKLKGKKSAYFHAQLKENPNLLSLDISQMQRTVIDEKMLAKKLAQLKLVKSAEMTMDPEDLSTNITFRFAKPVQVRMVAPKKGRQGSLIIIDLREDSIVQ